MDTTEWQQSNLGPSQHCHNIPSEVCSQKQLLQKQSSSVAQSHSTSATSWAPNSHMVPLSISFTTRVTQSTNIGLKTRLPRARRLRGSFSIILLKVSCLFPFLKSLTVIFKKFICRISKFPRRRNSDNLITGLQIVRLVYEFLSFLFGVRVKTSWIQSGPMSIAVS